MNEDNPTLAADVTSAGDQMEQEVLGLMTRIDPENMKDLMPG